MTEAPAAHLRSQVESESVDGVETATVAFDGDFDLPMVPTFQEAVAPERLGDPGAVILDFTEVRFIDSSGVHAFVTAWSSLRSSGKRTAAVIPPGSNVERVLAMTGLLEEIAPAPDRETAVAAVAGEG